MPYLNLYVANGVVVVPVCGHPADDDMLAIIAEQFPERATIGLDVGAVLAYGGGGIHCITQQVPRCGLPGSGRRWFRFPATVTPRSWAGGGGDRCSPPRPRQGWTLDEAVRQIGEDERDREAGERSSPRARGRVPEQEHEDGLVPQVCRVRAAAEGDQQRPPQRRCEGAVGADHEEADERSAGDAGDGDAPLVRGGVERAAVEVEGDKDCTRGDDTVWASRRGTSCSHPHSSARASSTPHISESRRTGVHR